jgi:hypothetical protein
MILRRASRDARHSAVRRFEGDVRGGEERSLILRCSKKPAIFSGGSRETFKKVDNRHAEIDRSRKASPHIDLPMSACAGTTVAVPRRRMSERGDQQA